MRDFVDATAFNCEQGNRARKLFAAVVLAALDDAIADDKKYLKFPKNLWNSNQIFQIFRCIIEPLWELRATMFRK